MRKSLFVLVIVMLLVATTNVTMAQQYDVSHYGSNPVNWACDQIAGLNAGDAQVASKFEAMTDLYWSDPQGRWQSPDGKIGTGWGHKGLSYFALYLLGREYKELQWSGVVFTPDQQQKLHDVLVDGIKSAMDGSFYYYGPCNGYNGTINRDDSCGEDDGSINKFFALVGNLFPEIVSEVGGQDAVSLYERKFYEKSISTDYEHGGDLLIVGDEVTLPNHGGDSKVYALVNTTGVGNVIDLYIQAGKPVPRWYKNDNLLHLFQSVQKHALSDGSAFTDDCVLNNGQVVSCGDPGVANAVPKVIPGGRAIRFLFGDGAFLPGLWTFEECDQSLLGKQGNFNMERNLQFCIWNPPQANLGLLLSKGQSNVVDVKWLANANQSYDVWGPNGRVVQGIADDFFSFSDVPCGAFGVSLFAFSGDRRITGWQKDAIQIDCSHMIRRHLKSLPITTIIVK